MRSRKWLVWGWIAVIAAATTLVRGQDSDPDSGGQGRKPVVTPDGRKLWPADREGTERQPEAEKPEGKEDAGKKEEGKKDESGGKKPGGGGLFGGSNFLFIMIGGFILLYFLMSRGRRKQAAKRKEMLSALKKGDKITTIGGVVGTVMEVREDEVTVKVDETNNIRVRFARWSIRGIGDTAKAERPEDKR